MGYGSADKVETEKVSGRKRPSTTDDIFIDDLSSDPKNAKLEVKVEEEDTASSEKCPEPVSAPKLSSVQVLGHDLFYRHHGTVVLFKTSSVMDMLSKSLPLLNPSKLENVVDKSGEQNSLVTESSCQRAFIS